jgi:hypothetical protein
VNDELKRIDYRGFTIRIHVDQDPPNPRKDYDNLGTMVCLHGRYELGDENKMTLEEANELEAEVEKEGGVVLKLWLYDHSGITIATKPFSCQWDSGRVGFIYVRKQQLLNEYGFARDVRAHHEKARQVLEGEVETYDKFLTGSYCGYVIVNENDEEEDDSCFGFEDSEVALDEAKATVDAILRHRQEELVRAEESVTGS